MPIECNAQGQIEVNAIVEAVNQNETDIANVDGGGTALEARVTQNEADILSQNSRLVTLENQDVTALEGRVSANETDIANNASTILGNSTDIATLGGQVTVNTTDIATNTTDTAQNTADIFINTDSIALQSATLVDHESRIAALEAASGSLATAVLLVHEEPAGIDGGASAAGTWTPRNIQTVRYNSLGAVVGANSVTLAAGTYKVEGFAIAEGGAHQTRISIGGVTYLYGTTMNSDGQSIAMGKFTITTATVVTIETNVAVGVPATGFGTSSTFGTPNVYASLHIDKVG